jgi:peptidoglycan/LPS O-acetylase OafA/YrhL
MQYRREVDGLRALAVIPVVLFHAGFATFSGGYVGVDVFFVISGYLITTILLEQKNDGGYSILRFYERRARRILPALFFVMACCIPFALMWMPAYAYLGYSRSMAFAAAFLSNMHFLDETGGYFSGSSELQPLLHTWSLGIEGQFYLLFPLLLALLARLDKGAQIVVLSAMIAASLGLADWGSRNFPEENFFFSLSRFWELLAGSVCAIILMKYDAPKRGWLAGLGVAMILASVFIYDASVPSPSRYTILPVLGTMIVIVFTAPSSIVGKMLSLRLIVGIGVISYSAYLWHQPLFAFARLRVLPHPSDLDMLILSVLAFGLGYLTWRFIEEPFRSRGFSVKIPPYLIGLGSGLATVGFIAFGFLGVRSDGFPQRMDTRGVAGLEQAFASIKELPEYEDCTNLAFPKNANDIFCTAFSQADAKRTIALIGDSHAQSLLPAFEYLSKDISANIIVGIQSACPPLLGVYTARSRGEAEVCHDYMENAAESIVSQGISAVFMVSKWNLYTDPGYFGRDPKFKLNFTPMGRSVSLEQSRQAFEVSIEQTISFFRDAGVTVFLVPQVPEQRISAGFFLDQLAVAGYDQAEAREMILQSFVTRQEADLIDNYSRETLSQQVGTGVHLLSFNDAFEIGDRYSWFIDDTPLYRDSGHLSLGGALLLRGQLSNKVISALDEGS